MERQSNIGYLTRTTQWAGFCALGSAAGKLKHLSRQSRSADSLLCVESSDVAEYEEFVGKAFKRW